MKYKITDIRQRSKPVKGVTSLYMRIYYETEEDYEGTIDLLKKDFNEVSVIEAIEEEIGLRKNLISKEGSID